MAAPAEESGTLNVVQSVTTALEREVAAAEGARLPTGTDFYYYSSFTSFKQPLSGFQERIKTLLSQLPGGSSGEAVRPALEDPGEVVDHVVGLLDDTLELVDVALDAARAPAGAPQGATGVHFSGSASVAGPPVSQRGRKPNFAQFADIPRPQDQFEDAVDNSNTPFQLSTSGEEAELPDSIEYQPWQLEATPPQPPKELEATPLTYIDTVAGLRGLAAQLAAAREVAVDLEHHSYRSFQGFTCLLQISTRAADYIVDTLQLRSHIGPELGGIFRDAAKVKVLHGADHDIAWLQRDFGILLHNMFDTGQAARVLGLPGFGLGFLLAQYAGVEVDKGHQMSDWRVRPLPADMLAYARCDTHYLLHVYDRLKSWWSWGERVPTGLAVPLPVGGPQGALGTVLERSRQLTRQRWQRPLFRELDYLAAAPQDLTPRQLAVFAGLYAWRDKVCRELDESTGYVLSRAVLLKLARAAPASAPELRRAVGHSAPLVLARDGEVLRVIAAAQEQAIEGPSAVPQQPPLPAAASAAASPVSAVQPALRAGPSPSRIPAAAVQPASVKAIAVKRSASGGGGGMRAAMSTSVSLIATAAPLAQPKGAENAASMASTAAEAATNVPAPGTAPAEAAHTAAEATVLSAAEAGAQPAAAVAPVRAVLAQARVAARGSAFGRALGAPRMLGTVTASSAAQQEEEEEEARRRLAVSRIQASFASPFTHAAADAAPPAAQQSEPALDFHATAAEPHADAALVQRTTGADIRAAVNQMTGANGATPSQQQPSSLAQPHQSAASVSGAADYLPLPISEQYSLKTLKRKRATDSTRGAWRDRAAAHAASKQTAGSDKARLEAAYRATGLEGDSDEEPGSRPQQPQEAPSRAGGPASSIQQPAPFDYGRNGGGRRGRGGRGGQRGRGERGRGGRQQRDPWELAAKDPSAKKRHFNPYEIDEDNLMKGGKRSGTAARSGNKTMTFAR